MTIETAMPEELSQILPYDRHIPQNLLAQCVDAGHMLVLKNEDQILGILRWGLCWQTVPFLDLIFLDEALRGKGCGTRMMAHWEARMSKEGYAHVMTSTQEDESAWQFYEKLGYRKIGTFLPPDQEAPELMYCKKISK